MIINNNKLFFQLTLNLNVHYFENAFIAGAIGNLIKLVTNSDIHPEGTQVILQKYFQLFRSFYIWQSVKENLIFCP